MKLQVSLPLLTSVFTGVITIVAADCRDSEIAMVSGHGEKANTWLNIGVDKASPILLMFASMWDIFKMWFILIVNSCLFLDES